MNVPDRSRANQSDTLTQRQRVGTPGPVVSDRGGVEDEFRCAWRRDGLGSRQEPEHAVLQSQAHAVRQYQAMLDLGAKTSERQVAADRDQAEGPLRTQRRAVAANQCTVVQEA